VLDRHRLDDHPAHRQAHDVGLGDTEGVEHGERVVGHVAQPVARPLVVDRRAGERRRQPHVAVVEPDDLEAAAGEHLAPCVVVVRALAAEAVDE
jgi:hypothetical protein